MNFFEAQDRARRSTLWLVLLFGLAVIGLILLTNLLVMFVIAYQQSGLVTMGNHPGQPALPWHTFIPVALGVIYCDPGTSYEDAVYHQIGSTELSTADGDLNEVLRAGQTWVAEG